MLPTDLALGAESHFDQEGFYALSVFSVPGQTADEIATGVPLPHSAIRESTVGRVRAAGYDVVPSPGPPGHADLLFAAPPTAADWRMLNEIFDPPHRNPATMRDRDA